jgi:hypothetical protein
MIFGKTNETINKELTETIQKVYRLEGFCAALEQKLDAQTQKLNSLRALMNKKLGYEQERAVQQEETEPDSPIPGLRFR